MLCIRLTIVSRAGDELLSYEASGVTVDSYISNAISQLSGAIRVIVLSAGDVEIDGDSLILVLTKLVTPHRYCRITVYIVVPLLVTGIYNLMLLKSE